MGRREAWSAERTDSKTKPTRWEFSRRGLDNEALGIDNPAVQMDNDEHGTSKFNVKTVENKETVNIM